MHQLQEQALNRLQAVVDPSKEILLVGNRGNKNLWDELILVGLVKLLEQIWFQPSQIIVPSADIAFSQNFLKQFLQSLPILIPEIPKWIRSWLRYSLQGFRGLKTYTQPSQVILWWWEILTPETRKSFWFWHWSLLPLLTKKAKIVIMGGVSPPSNTKEKKYFDHILKNTSACLCRDFESIQKMQEYWFTNAKFVMDTSFFALDDRTIYKKTPQNKVSINLHHFSSNFLDDLIWKLQKFKPAQIDFIPAGLGRYDKDLEFKNIIEQKLNKKIMINRWDQDFQKFLNQLWDSQKVISARLHLFLIAKYIGLQAEFFAYQTKLVKMDKVLKELGF